MPTEEERGLRFEIGHVLFIDIIGYSKKLITEQSELLRQLTEAVRETEQFRKAEGEGKLVRLPTGDGMALVFRDRPEAPVKCALELGKRLLTHPKLSVRMGIHSGPVNEVADVNERTNITGAGINIAQRVMDCGDAGHILLSKRVADDLEQYPQWQPNLHDLGECEVKHGVRVHLFNLYGEDFGNALLPARVRKDAQAARKHSRRRFLMGGGLIALALLAAAAIWERSYRQPGLTSIAEKSIAVLPFENLSEDKGNAYFAEGIQDEILTRLANLRALKVISRTSTAKYKSRPENLKTIAAELGVANILEGTVQKVSNDVHINVQLIKAETDEHLWAQSYDRTLEHVFAVEGEVAQTVADALKITLLPAQIAKLKTLPTENAQAYDLFLRGQYEFNRAWAEADALSGVISKAADYFREATKIDPQFSLAYASIARAELSEYHFRLEAGQAGRRPDLAEDAKYNIDRSLGLTPELAMAHLAFGEWYCWVTNDYPKAVQELQQALNLDSHLTDATTRLAGVARRQGHPEQAIEQLRSALPTDPRNVVIYRWMGEAFQMQRQYVRAGESLSRALALDPNDLSDIVNLAGNFGALGDFGAAERVLDSYPLTQRSDSAFVQTKLGVLLRKRDYRGMEEFVNNTPTSAFGSEVSRRKMLGVIAQGLGRTDAARDFFEQARSATLALVSANPDEPGTHAELGWLDATLNRAEEAISEGQRAVELSQKKDTFLTGADSLASLATIYAKLGRADDAIPLLTRLFSTPTGLSISVEDLKHHPDWDPIRRDPRFQKLATAFTPNESK